MGTFTGYGTFSWNTSGVTVGSIKPIDLLADWANATVQTLYYRYVLTAHGYDGQTYVEDVDVGSIGVPKLTITFSVAGRTVGVGSFYASSDILKLSGAAFYQNAFAGDDSINGGDGPDVLFGWNGDDKIYGNGGDDFLSGGGGVDQIFGGPGIDTAIYSYDSGDYLVSRAPSNGAFTVMFKAGGTTEYVHWDVEKFQFRDVTVDATKLPYYGTWSAEKTGSVESVYRFFNTRDKAFFYTTSTFERDMILDRSSVSRDNVDEWPFVYQGTTFEDAHTYKGGVALERFYNTQTGHHFFTISQPEAEMIKGKIAAKEWPFVYEGKTFSVYASDPTPGTQGQEVAVERFYSPTLNRHWFTSSTEEINQIRLTGIWNDEGVAFWGELPGS